MDICETQCQFARQEPLEKPSVAPVSETVGSFDFGIVDKPVCVGLAERANQSPPNANRSLKAGMSTSVQRGDHRFDANFRISEFARHFRDMRAMSAETALRRLEF
jgi:hypothetical protein